MRGKWLKTCLLSFAALLAVSSIGIGVSAWSTGGSTTQLGTTGSASSTTVTPVCYNASTSKEYPTIRGALNEASSGQYIYQYIGTSVTESQNLTIKSGVHLVLPFAGKSNLNDSTSPIYDLGSDGLDDISNYGSNFQGDQNSNKVATHRKCVLNMRNGADITINSGGYLHLGGVFNTTGNKGFYSEINLGSESSIECFGTFDCYGYVKENIEDAINPVKNNLNLINNSIDSGRYISMKSGSTLNSFMAMYDAVSGGTLATCIQNKKYCPFWTYDFPALQTYTEFLAGSTFKIAAILNISNLPARGTGTIIGSSSGLFILSSGSVAIEYSPATSSAVQYTTSSTKSLMVFGGNVSLSSLSISVSGQSINTSDFFLPISYKQILHISPGSSVNLNSKVKFLNESELHIANGGILNVNHQAIFYTTQAVTLSGATHYNHNSKDSLCDNNGTIVVNDNNSGNGKIGAIISHSNQENSIATNKGRIDLTKATSGSLSVTAIEDGDNNEVTVSTKALFIVDDNDHTQGTLLGELSLTKEYYSGYDSSLNENERYYWVGDFVSTVNISVTIESSTFRFPFKKYTLKSNTTASATGAEILADDADTSQTYTIQSGLYINFTAPNVSNITMIINGILTTYDPNAWIKVTSGANIVLTPSQGCKVKLTTTGQYQKVDKGSGMVTDTSVDLGNSDTNYDSGRGSTTVDIYACATSNGTFTKVDSGTGDVTVILAANQYYRLYCSKAGQGKPADGGVLDVYTIEFTGKYYDFDVVAGTGSVQTGFTLTNQSQSNSHTFAASDTEWRVFTFGFKKPSSGGTCLLPNTLITMADGSKKPVKDVQAGDMVVVMNHETGQLDVAPITFNDYEDEQWYTVLNAVFSDGTTVGVISEHGFFDLDTMRYEYISESTYENLIGHRFIKEDGSFVTLLEVREEQQYTKVYEPTSFFHFNFYTEDLLSMPGGITGLFNIFEYDDNLQYNQEKYEQDIETYGLFTYEDLAPLGVTEIMFEAYAGKYLKVALGKGILTEEYLEYLIDRYAHFTD